MRVGFDHQIFAFQRYGGISRYVVRLAEQFGYDRSVELRIIAPAHVNGYLTGLPKGIVQGVAFPSNPITVRIAPRLSRILAPSLMRSFRPDIVHETYYAGQPSAPRGARTVLTVHDMIHEKFPGQFGPRDPANRYKRTAVARADQIICVSESTRRDLIDIFPQAERKASVVSLGFDHFTLAEPAQALTGASPYLLYVGDRRGYKNFGGLLRAYAASPALRQEVRIICFGGGAFTAEETAAMARLSLTGRHVTQLSGSDELLAAYYNGATGFVYPSLYEGFGIPPLEAMSAGCPVACSDRSSIPEVCGAAALYFDPIDVDDMRNAMERLVGDSAMRDDLIGRGRVRLKQFSWRKCADQTLEIYRKLG